MSDHTHEHTHTYTHEHPHGHDGQEHSHEHTHTYTHSHEHSHDGNESHEHTHNHEVENHDHEYAHQHGSHHHHDEPIPESKDRMVALLDYNCQHNESHASELKRLAEKLKDQGYEAEAAKVSEACDAFEKGNAALREALDLLKKA
ncbi:hypothetical protein [Butyrivibrio sp. AE2032]|uniref:hypothetical protein n=1 Tax=Butyrivibrio sp. AE2032 TaxID=1458463 RepID=UPI000553A690|nr:hypothetical protein [Butyrivibrio sp. AE2032]